MRDPLRALIAELRAKYGDDTARAALAARAKHLAPEKRARLEALIFLDGQMGDVSIGNVAGGDQLSAGRDAAKGERAAPIIKAGVERHGDADEKADLASFERNPARYEGALAKVLTDIAAREPAFAGQLQTIADEANIQTGGVHGEVIARDNAKIQGMVAGVNEGTMTITFTFSDEVDTRGSLAHSS